jgi:hypothetical protein
MMTQGEGTIVNGSGSQNHSSGRWGDYSMMGVDPTDDCTFWYTQEYYAVTSSASWQTRVGSFKIRDCGGGGNNPPSVNIVSPAQGSTVSGTVAIQISASDVEDVAGTLDVEWNVDGGAWMPAAYNSGTDSYEASWDTTTESEGNHTLNARATDSGGAMGTDSKDVTVDNGGGATTLHVGDLDGTSTSQSGRWTAFVTITVHDSDHAPVANATVSGAWSSGASGTASCITNISGVCTVSKNNIRNNFTSVTFTVNNITHATLSYSAADNHDPDGGSNGTVIVVNKP